MDHRHTDDHAQHHHGGHGHGAVPAGHDELDRDLNLRGIAWTVAGLVALVIAAHLIIWYLLAGFDRLEERRDPEPLPLPAANRPPVPPEPRLQPSPEHEAIPEQDLRQMREGEDDKLSRPQWIDEAQGTLRIPIEAAIDLLAERGLPAAGAGGPTPDEVRDAIEDQGRPGRQPGGQSQMPGGSPPGAGAVGPPPETPPDGGTPPPDRQKGHR